MDANLATRILVDMASLVNNLGPIQVPEDQFIVNGGPEMGLKIDPSPIPDGAAGWHPVTVAFLLNRKLEPEEALKIGTGRIQIYSEDGRRMFTWSPLAPALMATTFIVSPGTYKLRFAIGDQV